VGIENYLFNDCPDKITNESEIIIDSRGQSVWNPRSDSYKISVIGYESAKKYAGLKAYITYRIKTEKFPRIIQRRYNQFLWLYNRLSERYPNICLPVLPDKSITSNFDENFIERRKSQLELWLNRLSAHPVIREYEPFIHFLMADDSEWKEGKRKAENENLIGAKWIYTIKTTPNVNNSSSSVNNENLEEFSKTAILVDNRLKDMISIIEKINQKDNMYNRDLVNFGGQLNNFGVLLRNNNIYFESNQLLSDAFVTTGSIYIQIGNMYGEIAKTGVTPLLDKLNLYRRVFQKVGQCVQFEKTSNQCYENFQRQDRVTGLNFEDIARRKDVITQATFAEINFLNKQKIFDLTVYMREFLEEQVKHYVEISECFKKALKTFEDIPV